MRRRLIGKWLLAASLSSLSLAGCGGPPRQPVRGASSARVVTVPGYRISISPLARYIPASLDVIGSYGAREGNARYLVTARAPYRLESFPAGKAQPVRSVGTFACSQRPFLLGTSPTFDLYIFCTDDHGTSWGDIVVPSTLKMQRLWSYGQTVGFPSASGLTAVVGDKVFFDVSAGPDPSAPQVGAGILDVRTGTIAALPAPVANGVWLIYPSGPPYVFGSNQILYRLNGTGLVALGSLPQSPLLITNGHAWTFQGQGTSSASLIEETPGRSQAVSWPLGNSHVITIGPGWALVLSHTPELGANAALFVKFPMLHRTVRLGMANVSSIFGNGENTFVFAVPGGHWHKAVIRPSR